MKAQKFTISLILLLAISLSLFAEHVEVKDAQTVGKNFYWENSRNENPIVYDAIVPQLFTTESLNGNALYYVFNINSNDGFVIVAADDNVTPVLGYSTSGTWTGENMPPAVELMLASFEDQITAVIEQNLDGDKEIETAWEQYGKFNPDPPAYKAVSPLLTTTWNQNQYYNQQCPADAAGPGGHAYAGCAAVSMAQVIKYWQHPTTGTGSNSYTHSTYGTISANFGATTYNYALMPNSISTTNFEVAQLLFHCGVSVKMNYGPTGSAPFGPNWATDVENALKNNFNYSSTLGWKWKNNYSTSTWISMLKAELDQSRPLIYYGWDGNNTAHQFNCDGYNNNNYFHFNMGWSGSYDGYYLVTNLNPYYNFTYYQGAIFNMYPVSQTQSYDFGDAPDPSYPTKLASGGACHVVPANPSVFLGVLVDTEPDGQPHINCNGDDFDLVYPPANDDEDGVLFPTMYVGTPASITVTVTGSGYLQGWMDFTKDGDWADAGEQIFVNLSLSSGTHNLSVTIPATAYVGWTYARFRYSTAQNIGFGGQAPDGEVEDYFVRFEEAIPEPTFDMLFSVDIGSDTELSDPAQDNDEVFDPGDAYLLNGTYMPLPGADGYFDDIQAFVVDPLPDGGVAGTGAPCLSGLPIEQEKINFFDMDGIDLIATDLQQFVFGMDTLSTTKFNDPYIHYPDSIYISFDDDDMFPYTDPSGSIPRMGFSSNGALYGQQLNKDEIIEVDLNNVAPNQAQIWSITPKYNEVPIHPNLAPDPDFFAPNPNDFDDDVDALDVPYELNDTALVYFSADHEAVFTDNSGLPLNPGSIYLATAGQAVEVINAQTDIGLPPGTDVDAFEFAWVFDPQQNRDAFALIFSVDEDDPTTPLDESGGLLPGQLYVSYLTGMWFDYTTEPFQDDIDALTLFATPGSQQTPKADFTPLNSLIYAGQPIQFFDISTGSPNSWNWTFAGGNPANHNGQMPPLVMYLNPGVYQVTLTVTNAYGSDTKTGTVKVLPPDWGYNITNLSHVISIPVSVNPTVNGSPLNSGDVIGVFHTDFAGNVVCGGYVIWDGVNNLALTAYGDDPTTPSVKEGFANGENFVWKVYSWSNAQAYPVSVTYDPTLPNYDGKYYDNGLSALTTLGSYLTQTINISQGWNGLSSYLDPADKNLDTIFKAVQSDLTILLNLSGVYWPTAGINTLGQWNPYDGYVVKVNKDVTLNIPGSSLTNRSIVLNPGWHVIPVLSSNNVAASTILGVPGVVLAKEIGGNKVYWPAFSIYTLTTLETGKAYIVYVTTTVTITYPAKGSGAGPVNPEPEITLPESWNGYNNTPYTHLIAISEGVGQMLEKGDVIGVFNAQGINAGYVAYRGKNTALAAFGDDQYTGETDGLLEGEDLFFKAYRPSTGEVFDLDVAFDPGMPDPDKVFTPNGLSVMQLKTAIEETPGNISVDVYPNPANNYLNIHSTGTENVPVNLKIIDAIGKVVYSNDLDPDASITIDVSRWSEGCYILSLTGHQSPVIKKIIIR